MTTFAAATHSDTSHKARTTVGKKEQKHIPDQFQEAEKPLSSLVIQTKLTVGQPGDKYEQEADAIADRVMQMPDPQSLQRKCTDCEQEEKVQTKPLSASITPYVQRQTKGEPQIGASLESRLNSSKSSGYPLPDTTRSFMEPRIGADFSNVNIHTDSSAVQMSRELGAQAFTHGNHIYFNTGKYSPESPSGKHLLAHEMVHTLQQSESIQPLIQRSMDRHVVIPDSEGRECPQLFSQLTDYETMRNYHFLGNLPTGSVVRIKGERVLGGIENWSNVKILQTGNVRCVNPLDENAHSSPEAWMMSTFLSPTSGAQHEEEYSFIEEASATLLDWVLPVNNGFYFEITGGITWGYPINTGGSAMIYVDRTSENTVRLLVRKQGRLAFDTGVGASFMIGRPGRRSGSQNNGLGIGAEAGANFMAGISGTFIEEYHVPTASFLGLLVGQVIFNMNPLITRFLERHANQFLVNHRIEAGIFAQADAEAGVGIRRPTDNFNEGSGNRRHGGGIESNYSTWRHNETRDFQGSRPRLTQLDPASLLNFLGLFAQINLNAQLTAGFDQKWSGDTTTTSLSIEGQFGMMLDIPIPVVNSILSNLPSGAGGGVEIRFVQRPDAPMEVRVAIYTKQGEGAYYNGSAGQQNMEVNLTNIVSVDQIMDALMTGSVPSNLSSINHDQMLDKVSFFQRIVLGGQQLRGFSRFLQRQMGTRSLLSNGTVYGINLEAYLDFAAEMSGTSFMRIARQLFGVAQGVVDTASEADSFAAAYDLLSQYFAGYIESEEFESLLNNIMGQIYVTIAKLRLQIGGGIGGAGQVAGGAKIRLDLSGEAGISCELDLLEGSTLILSELFEGIQEVLDNPYQYLPDCPIISALYPDESTVE